MSPGLSIHVLAVAQACAKLAIPGALTPTELMHAQDSGAKLVKIFPCGNVGGAKYLQSLRGPFPNAALIPTGGVNASNAADYITAGAFALGVGGDLVNAAALRSGNLSMITQAARELVRAVHSARELAWKRNSPLHQRARSLPNSEGDVMQVGLFTGWNFSRISVTTIFVLFISVPGVTTAQSPSAKEPQAAIVHIDATPGHAINSFDPDSALGSSIDVLSHDDIDKVYTPHIIQESLSAGWGPITYRNNSELRMAAWHWTENGTWSDPVHKSGYFTGSTELKEPIRYILSYALPHRGFSTSGDRPLQGPNLSYWKSNPYLTSKFTGESDALHPQWVVVDLKE